QSDRHTSEDWLDVRPFARGLATILASGETETPLVIGIQGRWGKGKSSFVAMIEDELEAINAELTGLASMEQPGSQVRFVWFNAWQYDGEGSIWAGLAQAIFGNLENQIGPVSLLPPPPAEKDGAYEPWARRFGRWIRQWRAHVRHWRHQVNAWCYRLLYIVRLHLHLNKGDLLALVAMAAGMICVVMLLTETWKERLLGAGGLVAALFALFRGSAKLSFWSIKDQVGKYMKWPEYREISAVNPITEHLRWLIARLHRPVFQKPLEKLVVVVDDLDRCKPGNIVEVLQTINLVLGQEHIVALLPMDTRVICRAVRTAYMDRKGGTFDREQLNEFLEKVVHVSFPVPDADEVAIQKYARNLLRVPAERREEAAMPQAPKEAPEPPGEPAVIKGDAPSSEAGDRVKKAVAIHAAAKVSAEQRRARDALVEQARDELERVKLEIPESARFAEQLPHADTNPRVIKRLVNMFSICRFLISQIQKGKSPPWGFAEDLEKLGAWLILCNRFPRMIHDVESHTRELEKEAAAKNKAEVDATEGGRRLWLANPKLYTWVNQVSDWLSAAGEHFEMVRDLRWADIAGPLKLATAVSRATWAVSIDAEQEIPASPAAVTADSADPGLPASNTGGDASQPGSSADGSRADRPPDSDPAVHPQPASATSQGSAPR
ncbi:MAG: hypothetical protein JSU68_04310, partial [Phycisphaerales bacterium]